MQQAVAQFAIHVHQRSLAQPVEQFIAIRCKQYFAQFRIDLGLVFAATLGNREQRKIVVAEHDNRAVAQRLHRAQYLQ